MRIYTDNSGFYYVPTNKAGCWGNYTYVDPDGHYLPSEPHILHNAELISDILFSYGWSSKAIAAVLGNMIAESVMNPAQGEIGKKYLTRAGYGLCQWTPATDYVNWAKAFDHDVYLGVWQVDYLVETGEDRWIINPDYPYNLSWDDFIHYDSEEHSAEWLAMAFFRNYERGSYLPTYRQDCAYWYYEYFMCRTPQPVPPYDPTSYRRYQVQGMPLWMMLRRKEIIIIEES